MRRLGSEDYQSVGIWMSRPVPPNSTNVVRAKQIPSRARVGYQEALSSGETGSVQGRETGVGQACGQGARPCKPRGPRETAGEAGRPGGVFVRGPTGWWPTSAHQVEGAPGLQEARACDDNGRPVSVKGTGKRASRWNTDDMSMDGTARCGSETAGVQRHDAAVTESARDMQEKATTAGAQGTS